MTTRVTLVRLEQAGPKQRDAIERATRLLETAVNDPSFPDEVLNADYRGGTYQQLPDGSVVERSPDEILAYILQGRESGETPGDGAIELEIVLWPHRRGVVGSTGLGKQPIRTAYWFMNDSVIPNDDIPSLAAHLMHEWMHVAGFYHRGGNRTREDVAYVLGDIVEKILGSAGLLSPVDDRQQ